MLAKFLKWLAMGIGIALAFPIDAVESNLHSLHS